MSPLLIPRLFVNRYIVHVGADILCTYFLEERTALFRGYMVNIEMEGTTPLGVEMTR